MLHKDTHQAINGFLLMLQISGARHSTTCE